MHEAKHAPTGRAAIFDLDGTLTHSPLDFDAIRDEIGIVGGEPILEAIGRMTPADARRARDILHAHERRAAETCPLRSSAVRTVARLRDMGFAVGILTRNAAPWLEIVLRRHELTVDAVHTRDDGPIKPAPDGVIDLLRRFNADRAKSWMIGDYLFDIQAGRAAGVRTVLIADGEPPPYAHQADFVIRDLIELVDLLADGVGDAS